MDYKDFLTGAGTPFNGVGAGLFILLMIWSLIWKGLALWKAARRGDSVWYVLLLILNTVGILEILYYFLISKGKKEEVK